MSLGRGGAGGEEEVYVEEAPLLFTGGGDAIVNVWSWSEEGGGGGGGGALCHQSSLAGHEGSIYSVVTTSDLLFSASQDCTIRAWDIEVSVAVSRISL
jgi:WD40 repeat protein